jgi:hypothetical protein
MSVSLNQLREITIPIPIKYNNYTVNVEVAIDKLDADLLDKINEADKSNDTQGLRLLLSQVIVKWDLFINSEGDFPPTVENIGQCSLLFLNILVREIYQLISGNPK